MEVSLVDAADRGPSGRAAGSVAGWWSSQALLQGRQEPVVLLGEAHGHPQAPGEPGHSEQSRTSTERSRRWVHTCRAGATRGRKRMKLASDGQISTGRVGQGGGDPPPLLLQQGHPGLHLVGRSGGPADRPAAWPRRGGRAGPPARRRRRPRARPPGSRGACRPWTRSWRRSGPPPPGQRPDRPPGRSSRAERRGELAVGLVHHHQAGGQGQHRLDLLEGIGPAGRVVGRAQEGDAPARSAVRTRRTSSRSRR